MVPRQHTPIRARAASDSAEDWSPANETVEAETRKRNPAEAARETSTAGKIRKLERELSSRLAEVRTITDQLRELRAQQALWPT